MLLGCREKDENIFYGFTGADAVVAFCQEIVAIAKKYVSTACDSWKKDLKKALLRRTRLLIELNIQQTTSLT